MNVTLPFACDISLTCRPTTIANSNVTAVAKCLCPPLSFVSLNVEGLWRAFSEMDLQNFVNKYEVSESVHGRLSGGILFLVKNVIAKHIKQVFVETDNILVLRISRELTGALTDSILVGAYLPPQNPAY